MMKHILKALSLSFFFFSPIAYAGPTAYYVQGCKGNVAGDTVSCTMGSNITAGNLIIVRSKVQSATGTATAVVTSSAGVALTWDNPFNPPGVCIDAPCANFMNNTKGWAIAPSTGAQTVTVTWTGGNATFSDISVAEYKATYGWDPAPVDQYKVGSSGNTYAPGTTCSTGSTGPLAQAEELFIATCETWNAGQTWSNVAPFAHRAASERNTDGWYDYNAPNTSGRAAAVTINSDVWLGHLVSFKMNRSTTSKIRHKVKSSK